MKHFGNFLSMSATFSQRAHKTPTREIACCTTYSLRSLDCRYSLSTSCTNVDKKTHKNDGIHNALGIFHSRREAEPEKGKGKADEVNEKTHPLDHDMTIITYNVPTIAPNKLRWHIPHRRKREDSVFGISAPIRTPAYSHTYHSQSSIWLYVVHVMFHCQFCYGILRACKHAKHEIER